MRLLLFTSLAAVALAKSTPALDKPVFEITASRSVDEAPSITVSFASGVQDELMLTHYKMHERSSGGCNYLGQLRNSPSSRVGVTGCMNKPGDRMDITLISEHTTNKMFTVDFFGNTEIVNNPFEDGATSGAIDINRNGDNGGGWTQVGDEEINAAEEAGAVTASVVSIPSKLKAVIKFGYEEGMKARLGTQDFAAWIEGVFTHTQVHFKDPSLGTEIHFEVQGSPLFKAGATWTADNNIVDARLATNAANLNGVDTMSWWSNNGGGGTAGIAYVGALCMSYNTNLNEWQSTSNAAGFVLAHELGHNFGMSHDFDASHGGHSGACNGQGIMSYGSFAFTQWSTCSKSDWEQHYSSQNWGNGCLEDISATTAATTAAPTTAAPTTAAPTTAAPATAAPTWAPPTTNTTAAPTPSTSEGTPSGCFDVKLTTKKWGNEISWSIGSCTSNQAYKSNKVFTQQCCLAGGSHEITCTDSWGDGWNGGYLEINGKKYCDDFTSGKTKKVTMETSTGTPKPTTEISIAIKTTTKRYGNEVSWTLVGGTNSCASPTTSYASHKTVSQTCTLLPGVYTLTCKDSYGDGWHGGYIKIKGTKYCSNFRSGSKKTVQVTIAA